MKKDKNIVKARKIAPLGIRELNKKEQFLENIVNGITEQIFLISRDFKILWANKTFLEQAGCKMSDIAGKHCYKITHNKEMPCQLPHDICPVSEVFKTGIPTKAVHIHHGPKGESFLEVSAYPIKDEKGEVIEFVHISRDFTEQKLQNEKLEKAMAIKNEFTSIVSHELRTPLTAIKEGIGIVLDGSAGAVNAEQKDFLQTAERNVDRLARLINNVLDYQRLDSGKMEYDMREGDINELIRETELMMSLPAEEKKLVFSVNLADNLPKVNFDKDRIVQVLTNLVSNAIKFTDNGSITISSELGKNSVLVCVKDTGVGIKKEDMAKLFQSFSQISTGKNRKMGSSGLGLVISKGIIQQHGGKIWAESEFGKGTTIRFTLPAGKRG